MLRRSLPQKYDGLSGFIEPSKTDAERPTVAVWESDLSPTRGWDVLSALKFLLRPQARYSWCPGIILGLKKRLEVAAGLEPAKTGFADQRLDRFGIATKPSKTCTKPCAICTQVYTQNWPRSAYLPLFKSL